MSNITKDTVDSTWEFTRKLVEDCYPRLTGTEGCEKAFLLIKEDMDSFSDETIIHEFKHKPTGFLKFISFGAFLHVVALVLFLSNQFVPALIIFLFNGLMFISQLLFYWGLFDFPFKEEIGKNVIGVIEPKETAKQVVMLSGHYDAPYVFNILDWNQKWYGPIFGGGLATLVLSILFGIIIVIIDAVADLSGEEIGLVILKIVLSILSIPLLSFFVFTTNKVSPGAGDNAIAVGLIHEVGKILSKNRLENTRVMIFSVDAEEAGLNGASAFCRDNIEMILDLPIYNLNIDTIYDKNELSILTRDLNGTVELSSMESERLKFLSKDLGNELSLKPLPFGAGSTDSAAFAKAGIESICLVGLDVNTYANRPYHSSRDDMSALDKDTVEFCLKLVEAFAISRDTEPRYWKTRPEYQI